MERKLTAILSADVKGYSRLMGEDEEATIRTLTAYREVMAALIQQHRGRVVDSPGDNLLAEFVSAVDAVRCAVEVQHELKVKNAALPAQREMEFRMGLNVGDVVVEGERLYGDGVNIAARLEGLAEPGGICISGTVHDQVETKLALNYEYLGEQTVKNIAKPVRVWRVRMDPKAAATVNEAVLRSFDSAQDRRTQHERPEKRRLGTVHLPRAVLMLVGLLGIGGGVTWYLFFPLIRNPQSAIHNQEVLPLPLKPSIAVLPFTNMSSDSEQDYFSDGMTDTLITDLSKLSGLFVIARNSTFVYKGKAVQIKEVSRELGVRYVLEGSVQKDETRVRINAQLVDATTGHHVWAERYDRPRQDFFALQDEVTQKIVEALQIKLTAGEQERVWRRYTDSVEAYEYLLRGWEYINRFTPEANVPARQMFERAIELDPKFAEAYVGLSVTYEREWGVQWSPDPQNLERAFALAQKALSLDDSLPGAHNVLGNAYLLKGQPEQAIAAVEQAIALDPNDAGSYVNLAKMLNFMGRPEEAIGVVEKAMRLNPHYSYEYLYHLGVAYAATGRMEEAIAAQKRVLTRNPDFLLAHIELADIYNELGREDEARAEETAARRLNPNVPLELFRQRIALKKQQEEQGQPAARSFADSLKARTYLIGGLPYFFRGTQEATAQARQMFEKATELDPRFAWGPTLLGWTYWREWVYQWSQEPQTLERALTLARRAVALDDSSPMAHQLLGQVYLQKQQHERAFVEVERAITLAPDDADSYMHLGNILIYVGRAEESIGVVEKGMRLKPRFPAFHLTTLGNAYRLTGRYAEARDVLEKALSLSPDYLPAHVYLAVIYSELGQEAEARAAMTEVLRLSPHYSLEGVRQRLPYKDPAQAERYLAALRKAGLK